MRLRIRLGAAATALVTAVAILATGCDTANPPNGSGQAGPLRVAVILGGLANDGGFNQAGADAVKTYDADGTVKAQIRESVTNPADAEPIIRQYAAEGYDLIIGWSLTFAESVFRVGKEFPAVHFVTTGGADVLSKATANVETWTYDSQGFGYLLGFIAGQTGLSPVGIVDGPQLPFLEQQWFGFGQGLHQANPAATALSPIYTGSFEDAQKANQATTAQITSGAKLIATNAEGYATGVAAAAKAANVATVGMAGTTSEAAKTVNVGRVRVDLVRIFGDMLDRIRKHTFGNHGTTSTIANKSIVLSDFNRVALAPQLPPDLERRVADLADQLAAGKITIPPKP